MSDTGYNAPTTQPFKQLGITKLMDIYDIQLCKLMYSYTIGTLVTPLQTIFTNNYFVPSHQTRHSRDPYIVARKTSSATRTFIHQCWKAWLALPDNVKNCKSVKSFSQRVNIYYLSTYRDHCDIALFCHHLYLKI